MTDKLYKFLLVNPEILENDKEFKKYTAHEMYDKLAVKYKKALYALEYMKQYAELQMEELVEEKGKVKNVVREEYIEQIKNKYDISDGDIKRYAKVLVGEGTEKDIAIISSFTQQDKKFMEEIMRMSLEDQEQRYVEYKCLIKDIDKVESVFFKSFAYNDIYKDEEWENNNFDWFVLPLNVFFNAIIENDEIDEEEDNYCYIIKAISLMADNSKRYEKRTMNIKRGEEIETAAGFNTKSFEELVDYLNQLESAKVLEKDKKQIVESALEVLEYHYEKSLVVELGFLKAMIPSDKDYIRVEEYIKELGKWIEEYRIYERVKKIYYEDKVENEKEKLRMKKAKSHREKSYEKIVELLVEMKDSRRYALDKAFERMSVYNNKDLPREYTEQINVSLYKQVFDELKRDLKDIRSLLSAIKDNKNEKVEIKRRLSKETRNVSYTYKNLGLITICFTNTEIEKYRTALLIVDDNMIKNLQIVSSKSGWTLKNGMECNHKDYDKKTMTADRITANGKKLNIMDIIYKLNNMPDVEDVKKLLEDGNVNGAEIDNSSINVNNMYYTISHKFDLRSKNITKYIDKPKKEKMERENLYYSGKLRVEEAGDLSEDYTICLNGANNVNDAAILYFDDARAFKRFLDNMN